MSDMLNEDWIKTQTWDLPKTLNGIRTLGDLRALPHLPSWQACPEDLKQQILDAIERGEY